MEISKSVQLSSALRRVRKKHFFKAVSVTPSWLAPVFTIALLVLGFGRLAQVALHKPLLGYANNYDFIKISSTLGIWVDEPGAERTAGHPAAPFSHYRSHGQRIRELRVLSSELIFVLTAIVVADTWNVLRRMPGHAFYLRILGAVKAVCFFVVGVFVTALFFRRSAWQGLLSALIFAAVICDPFNTLYFNTLYFDDSAVLFGYLATGLGLFLVASEEPSGTLLGIFCVALVFAGLSKMQHAGLPLAIALGYCVGRLGRWKRTGSGRSRKAILFPLLAAVLVLWLGIVNNRSPSMRGMVFAAATDTWFGTVLPALKQPQAALESLGIPARCAAFVGKTWYDPGMQPPPCPEIMSLSRFQMVSVLLKEPSAAWRILQQAVPSTRPFIVFYGQVEGRSFGRIEDEGLRFASLGRFFSDLPAPLYVGLFIGSLFGGLVALVLLMRSEFLAPSSFCVLLSAVIASTFVACVLGDGYADLSRHFHLAQSALIIAPFPALLVLGRAALGGGRSMQGLLERFSARAFFC